MAARLTPVDPGPDIGQLADVKAPAAIERGPTPGRLVVLLGERLYDDL
jgi:hypothetical protein